MICNKCNIDKPIDNFYQNKKPCKSCLSKINSDRRKGLYVKRQKKLTQIGPYKDLEVDINKYEDYFEEGFQERIDEWFRNYLLKK